MAGGMSTDDGRSYHRLHLPSLLRRRHDKDRSWAPHRVVVSRDVMGGWMPGGRPAHHTLADGTSKDDVDGWRRLRLTSLSRRRCSKDRPRVPRGRATSGDITRGGMAGGRPPCRVGSEWRGVGGRRARSCGGAIWKEGGDGHDLGVDWGELGGRMGQLAAGQEKISWVSILKWARSKFLRATCKICEGLKAGRTRGLSETH